MCTLCFSGWFRSLSVVSSWVVATKTSRSGPVVEWIILGSARPKRAFYKWCRFYVLQLVFSMPVRSHIFALPDTLFSFLTLLLRVAPGNLLSCLSSHLPQPALFVFKFSSVLFPWRSFYLKVSLVSHFSRALFLKSSGSLVHMSVMFDNHFCSSCRLYTWFTLVWQPFSFIRWFSHMIQSQLATICFFWWSQGLQKISPF